MPSSGPSSRRRLLVTGLALLVLGVALGVWLKGRVPQQEVPLGDLVRMDGTLRYRSDTNRLFSGWVVETYRDGVRKSRSAVRDGLLQGVSEGWHTNGVPQVRENFAGGVASGPVARWHPNGAKLSEGTARAGQLEGPFRRWHPDGTIAEEFNMVAGQPNGLARSWHPDGSPKGEVTFSNGVPTARQFWPMGEGPVELAAKRPASAP